MGCCEAEMWIEMNSTIGLIGDALMPSNVIRWCELESRFDITRNEAEM